MQLFQFMKNLRTIPIKLAIKKHAKVFFLIILERTSVVIKTTHGIIPVKVIFAMSATAENIRPIDTAVIPTTKFVMKEFFFTLSYNL